MRYINKFALPCLALDILFNIDLYFVSFFFFFFEKKKSKLRGSRRKIMKMNKAIAKEERQLKQLENSIERDNLRFEEFLKENEKKSVEAKTHYEEEAKVKQRMNTEIKSEVAKLEETLKDYKRYKELLFKLSPPEWQYAQRVKGLKGKVPSHSDKQEEQMNLENGTEGGHTGLSSPQNLTEQNLSLIQNSSRVEETLEELQQSIEINKRKIEKDEEQIELQIKDMKQRIDKEKVRGVKLEQKVKLHVSKHCFPHEQDVMLEVLSEKVAEVHRSCVSDRMVNLSTLEKLASIESYMSTLMQGLENIPEDKLEMMKRIKDSERRSRYCYILLGKQSARFTRSIYLSHKQNRTTCQSILHHHPRQLFVHNLNSGSNGTTESKACHSVLCDL
uniref:DUF4200 domain-containing protein n=1 Tax=Gouania willdenowi TaxID=441366 RepID=A0A8C5DAQ0_GOUWI